MLLVFAGTPTVWGQGHADLDYVNYEVEVPMEAGYTYCFRACLDCAGPDNELCWLYASDEGATNPYKFQTEVTECSQGSHECIYFSANGTGNNKMVITIGSICQGTTATVDWDVVTEGEPCPWGSDPGDPGGGN